MNLSEPFYHFSIDDAFDSLIEIADKKISLFEQPFFAFLKKLHDDYGIKVDLYLFFQKNAGGKLRNLTEVPSYIKETLENNSWIRFGPHALDYETAPYLQTPEKQIEIFDKIYNEINRFASSKNLSKWVRLHYFSESYELSNYFRRHGVEALFTTDKERITTRMSESVNESLREKGFAEYNNLKLIRTHFRTENLSNEGVKKEDLGRIIDKYINKQSHICFLLHEYEFSREEVREITFELIKKLYNKNILSY